MLTFVLQAATAAQPQGGSLSFILMMVLIFAVMWLFMIRPQRKQQKAIEQFRNELKKGTKVLTNGGIIGEVVEVTDRTVLIKVDGESMMTTLYSGERLFVSVADVKFGKNISRGDVVICNYPGRVSKSLFLFDRPTYFVKRVVGVPGDVVWRENGVNYVQYETVDESGETVTVTEALDEGLWGFGANYDPYTLQEDEYFVVGDNRSNSHDSRDWNGWDNDPSNDVGPITGDMIVGHVRAVIWPLNSIRSVK